MDSPLEPLFRTPPTRALYISGGPRIASSAAGGRCFIEAVLRTWCDSHHQTRSITHPRAVPEIAVTYKAGSRDERPPQCSNIAIANI